MFFEAFSNDFERFFAKIDAFRTVLSENRALLSGFRQVRIRDYEWYTDWVRWVRDGRGPELRSLITDYTDFTD